MKALWRQYASDFEYISEGLAGVVDNCRTFDSR